MRSIHGLDFDTWVTQAELPLRFAGCGLRSSSRTAFAAYWASWADSIPGLAARFPNIAVNMLHDFSRLQSLDSVDGFDTPPCLAAAEMAGRFCTERGWAERPLWVDLASGLRPPEPPAPAPMEFGEFTHGWQFHASNALEKTVFTQILQTLALPKTRINAATVGKTRVHQTLGVFSSSWLTTCPSTKALEMSNAEMHCAVRRRLGIAVTIDGPDPHGHLRLADGTGGRTHARHKTMISAWKQVFVEAGASIPDRNVERLLRDTHIPMDTHDNRRLDLIASGLNVDNGLPLFCDVTILSSISRDGRPRPGTSNSSGSLLDGARRENDATYSPVLESGLGSLYCLGHDVYGRWGQQAVKLLPKLARERARGTHSRLRKGMMLSLQARWAGIISIALQKSVAAAVLRTEGADLATTLLEPCPPLGDLPIV